VKKLKIKEPNRLKSIPGKMQITPLIRKDEIGSNDSKNPGIP
jgi:hypothetical protein